MSRKDQRLHLGLNVVNAGSLQNVDGRSVVKLYFQSSTLEVPLKNAPSCDVVTACTRYLTNIVSIVRECYEVFGPAIDPRKYYTEENFERLGRTIEDAEEEVVGVRGWTDVPGVPLETRWQMLRATLPDPQVELILEKYLGEPVGENNAQGEENDDARRSRGCS